MISAFVPTEILSGEPRVACSADTVKRLSGLGFAVVVERGAGLASRITDEEFEQAGARLGTAADAARADLVLKLRRPTRGELAGYRKGAVVIATMDPYGNEAEVAAMAQAGVTAFAMDWARVMRGMNSMANAVTPACAIAATSASLP
jgi:H+-translocating NAD(P) transhydrogenase subunit alpha